MRIPTSSLAVPGMDRRLIEKAAGLDVDEVLIDLEDSVPAADKARAVVVAAEAVREVDYGHRSVAVRINGVDTGLAGRDVMELVGRCGGRLDAVVVPKVENRFQISYVDQLLTDIETSNDLPGSIRMVLLMETVTGVVGLSEMIGASGRVSAVAFGINGYLRDTEGAGLRSPDTVAAALAVPSVLSGAAVSVVTAATAMGVAAVAGPSRHRADEALYVAESRMLARIGFRGRWCVHPAQVPWNNSVFA